MAITQPEFNSARYSFEAVLHGILPQGTTDGTAYETPFAGIEAVQTLLQNNDPSLSTRLAWVDLAFRSVTRIKHAQISGIDLNDMHLEGFNSYPHENVSGKRIAYGEPYVATARTDDAVTLTPLSEIRKAGRITHYTATWIGAIAEARRYQPSFYRELSKFPADKALRYSSPLPGTTHPRLSHRR